MSILRHHLSALLTYKIFNQRGDQKIDKGNFVLLSLNIHSDGPVKYGLNFFKNIFFTFSLIPDVLFFSPLFSFFLSSFVSCSPCGHTYCHALSHSGDLCSDWQQEVCPQYCRRQCSPIPTASPLHASLM